MLLEQSLEDSGLPFVYPSPGIDKSLSVLKIHGSANWFFCQADGGLVIYDPSDDPAVDLSKAVFARGGLSVTGERNKVDIELQGIVSTGDESWVNQQIAKSFVPCMAAYMPRKPILGYEPSLLDFIQTKEWCSGWYGRDYYGKSPSVDPTGPPGGERRVLRGGAWFSNTSFSKCTHRPGNVRSQRDPCFGFRCAQDLN